MSSPQVAEYAREQMVSQQIRAWDVLDNGILNLFRRLPREHFAPAAYRDVAYADTSIPLAHGQHMLSPKLAGRILQALDVQPREAVLEVGTGSGFLSACLALQGAAVSSVEIFADLADQARRNLAAAGIPGVEITSGSLGQGFGLAAGIAGALVAFLFFFLIQEFLKIDQFGNRRIGARGYFYHINAFFPA